MSSNTSLIETEIFKIFVFWGTILALKLIVMVPLTAYYRFKNKVFSNPEDAVTLKGAKVATNDSEIERVRRAHLNDLENILIWYIVTFVWLTTNPSIWLASLLIRTFVIARILHTLVYVVFAKQPHRAITFFVGYATTLYQAVNILLFYM
ncbi:microsomal glutathione S-transferase 1 [Apis cerana]|uniref:Microsomal glutathione S-transferase 1 n=1 Tax=Apis cerana TaxID=7461 RepID=V9IL22_APICE|nr:microsomal glutathione S-transferase 1 [Apis cerana]XP_061926910.1 microsomal glutathione S-transferase 1 [Apis cerana]XP_061926911.1 microsomal glutathione S-transferase 1 [Apis cerana]XP_061926912.1 microsomal glutathione S-transferase 1 [Apis cerana]